MDRVYYKNDKIQLVKKCGWKMVEENFWKGNQVNSGSKGEDSSGSERGVIMMYRETGE